MLSKVVVTECIWQSVVTDLATFQGWHWFHPPDNLPVRTAKGKLRLQSVVAGFPDLVLVRDRVVYAEMKTKIGRVTAAQQAWHDRLRAAGAEVHVWRPTDLEAIRQCLR